MTLDSASPRTRVHPLVVHAALFCVALLFGANYIVAKVAMREITPLDLVVFRASATAAILFVALRLRSRTVAPPKLTRADFGQLFLYSLLGVSLNQLCFLQGLSRTTATNASIMLVSIPILTLAFAVMLRRERATLTGVLGIAIGLTGALLLIIPRGGVDLTSRATVGNLFLLAGGASYAMYLVLTRGLLARHEPLRVISWVFLFSALTVIPFGASGMRALLNSGISAAGWASIAYAIVGGTVIPYMLSNWALVRAKSSLVAVYVLLQPLIAGSLGRIFLHEQLVPNTAIAAVLVVSGVVLSGWRRGAT